MYFTTAANNVKCNQCGAAGGGDPLAVGTGKHGANAYLHDARSVFTYQIYYLLCMCVDCSDIVCMVVPRMHDQICYCD